MNNIVHVDFKKHELVNEYNADVYTLDMKKYQFNVVAVSINEAYFSVVAQAALHDIATIRCIAVYSGQAEQRDMQQSPEKVWQQNGTDLLIDGGL